MTSTRPFGPPADEPITTTSIGPAGAIVEGFPARVGSLGTDDARPIPARNRTSARSRSSEASSARGTQTDAPPLKASSAVGEPRRDSGLTTRIGSSGKSVRRAASVVQTSADADGSTPKQTSSGWSRLTFSEAIAPRSAVPTRSMPGSPSRARLNFPRDPGSPPMTTTRIVRMRGDPTPGPG
jgi:hypothetical protein